MSWANELKFLFFRRWGRLGRGGEVDGGGGGVELG